MSKLERLKREQEKARKKIAEQQLKLKALTGEITAAENIEIVSAVRALKLTQKELYNFIKSGKLPERLADKAAMPEARYTKAKPGQKGTDKQVPVAPSVVQVTNQAAQGAALIRTKTDKESESGHEN
jgi:hypothetical protein